MPRSPIAYIDVSFFAHATEDPEKVLKAGQNVVSKEFSERITFKKMILKGDHGNPIIFFKASTEEETVVESVLRYISSKLSALDKESLSQDLSLHLEKGNLYVRFDKQGAFKGDLRPCTADPIHMRIRFRKRKNEEITQICRDVGLLPREQ